MLGAAGTLIDLALGYLMLHQLMTARMDSMFENPGLVTSVAPWTMVLIVLPGARVVALTPLVKYRRLQRINIHLTNDTALVYNKAIGGIS